MAADKGDDSSAPTVPIPGYRLVTPVTRAARAEVWRARRATDGTPVAIKVFAAEDASRAAREAEIAAMVEHPHVVAPLEVVFSGSGPAGHEDGAGTDGGLAPVAAGGAGDAGAGAARPAGRAVVGVVLPWYDDGSLADLIAVRRRLRWREVLTVLIPLADALAAAHERGFVHGDLSPANVLFDPIGRPMLSDFGAARAATEAGAEVYATACDVAPEIVRGAAPSPATDLFSLGSVALACLTGRSAWFADDLQDVLIQSTAGQWPDLEDNMAPPALRVLVRRLLAPEAADRGSAAGLAVDLRRVGEPEPVELVPLDDDVSGEPAPAVRAATMVRPDALRPPADDWQPPPHPLRLRVAALLGAIRRVVRSVTARLSWRGAAATGAVAALAWGAMAVGWASAASPAHTPAAAGGAGAVPVASDVAVSIADPDPSTGPDPDPPGAMSMTGGAAPSAPPGRDAGPPATGSSSDASDPDWLAVMVRLDQARAAAFVTRDASLLGAVYAPGAPARRDDEARIAALRDANARVEQAAHDMLSAELVDLGPDGSVTLDVRQAQDSYAVYDASGQVAGTTPPVAESVRRVHLRPAEGGFRIVRVEEKDPDRTGTTRASR